MHVGLQYEVRCH